MANGRVKEWRDRLHAEAETRRIYGSVIVKYENGIPVHGEVHESRKPPRVDKS